MLGLALLLLLAPVAAGLGVPRPVTGDLEAPEPWWVEGLVTVLPRPTEGRVSNATGDHVFLTRDGEGLEADQILRADVVHMTRNVRTYEFSPEVWSAYREFMAEYNAVRESEAWQPYKQAVEATEPTRNELSADPRYRQLMATSGQVNQQTNTYTNVTLHLMRIPSLAQILVEEGAGSDAETSMSFDGARCALSRIDEGAAWWWPEDPYAQNYKRTPESGSVHADCNITAAEAQAVARILVYGAELRLLSDQGEFTIKTGVKVQTTPIGGGRRVIEVVHFDVQGRDGLFEFPYEARARIWSGSVFAAGDLQVPPSRGAMTWGSEAWPTEEGFQANGAYAVSWRPDGHMGLAGETFDGARTSKPGGADAVQEAVALAAAGLLATAGIAWCAYRLLFLPLYTKLRPERVLGHPVRQRLLQYVRDCPGTRLNTAGRALGLNWSQVVHHARVLEQHGHIQVRRSGGQTAVFPQGTPPGDAARLAILQRRTPRIVLECLRAEPGLDQRTVAARVGVSQQMVSRALRELDAAGLVVHEMDGRTRRYRAAAAAASADAAAEGAATG